MDRNKLLIVVLCVISSSHLVSKRDERLAKEPNWSNWDSSRNVGTFGERITT